MFKIKQSLLVVILGLAGASILFLAGPQDSKASICIQEPKDLAKIFPQTVAQIKAQEVAALAKIDQTLANILAVPESQSCFLNIMQPLDDLRLESGIISAALAVLTYLSPSSELRAQAQISSTNISQHANTKIMLNKQLYMVVSRYINHALNCDDNCELLTPAQKYFMQNTLDDFKRSGLDLPDQELARVGLLLHEITQLEQAYLANLGKDRSQITVSKTDLSGVPADFINSLKSNEAGELIINCDDNSYLAVMSNCTISQTREKLYRAYTKRAYPQNIEILQELINKRDQLAQLLGFKSYAQLDLQNQMVLSPENAQDFLLQLLPIAQAKAKIEIQGLKKDLPTSVVLLDGKIQPWDMLFIKNQYKLKYLAIDEQLISEYFTQETTIPRLLKIYENFLGLRFEPKTAPDLWTKTEDLQTLAVYQTCSNQLIGYLILDLFPRADKLPHSGAQISIIPPVLGRNCPALSVVLTNFARPQGTKPALMTYTQVKTFFHEFGHAMHALLGATELACHAGTNVKTDFVEMPSQMLEYWLDQPQTLAQISKHYQTETPLPNALIEQIIKSQTFDTGNQLLRQISLSLLSLALYEAGSNKDLNALREQLANQTCDYMVYDPQNMFLANFMHIADSGYGSKYYSYLWSRVFACDIFTHIKEQGLSDPACGARYVKQVLSQGGSCDPKILLNNFLGRAPNQEAFKKDLGL